MPNLKDNYPLVKHLAYAQCIGSAFYGEPLTFTQACYLSYDMENGRSVLNYRQMLEVAQELDRLKDAKEFPFN